MQYQFTPHAFRYLPRRLVAYHISSFTYVAALKLTWLYRVRVSYMVWVPEGCLRFSGKDGPGKSSNADDRFFQSNNESRETFNIFADEDRSFYIRKSSSPIL